MERLGIPSTRGRLRLRSPDPADAAKGVALQHAPASARRFLERVRGLAAAALGGSRQPPLADRYACWACWAPAPTAPLRPRRHTRWRIGGALDSVRGAVPPGRGAVVGVAARRPLLEPAHARSPDQIGARAGDTWPAQRHATARATAAPWTHPLEKLWRWMRQTSVHHHQQAARWPECKAARAAVLDQFAAGSPELLRDVGRVPL